jgi:uncharacterized protein
MSGSLNVTPPAGPRELFERWQRLVLANDPDTLGTLSADDVVLETPFAAPGHPRRIEGREQFLAFARPRRAALPARFEEFRNVVIHDTADPNVIVAEYELAGTVTTTGTRASAPFVVVLTTRDGKIVGWREYQDTLGMAISLGQLPAVAEAVS